MNIFDVKSEYARPNIFEYIKVAFRFLLVIVSPQDPSLVDGVS